MASADSERRVESLGIWSVARRGESEFDRGVSFFDAIYGFAATLLVSNLDPLEPQAWASLQGLADAGAVQQVTGFVLSFIVIAVFWRINVKLVRRLKAMDGPTVAANMLAACLVVLLPFTTQGISDPQTADLPLPTALYAVNVAAVAMAQTLMAQIARSRGLERHPVPSAVHRILLADALVTPLYFLATVPVALLAGAEAARLSWLGLLVVAPLVGRFALRRAEQRLDAAK